MNSFLSTTKQLGKIRLHRIFTVLINSIKKFLSKPKFNCFKKNIQYFSYSLLPKISKFKRLSLRLLLQRLQPVFTSFRNCIL